MVCTCLSLEGRLYLGQGYHADGDVVAGGQVAVVLLPVAALALLPPGRLGDLGGQLLVLVVLDQAVLGDEPVLSLARQVGVHDVVALES